MKKTTEKINAPKIPNKNLRTSIDAGDRGEVVEREERITERNRGMGNGSFDFTEEAWVCVYIEGKTN